MTNFIVKGKVSISKKNYRRISKMYFGDYPDDVFMKHLEDKQRADGNIHKVLENFECLIQLFFEIGVDTVWAVYEKDYQIGLKII